ncbi:TSUP family transporter [Phycicoccus sp. CSK15P-2]|uniref:TSUP family transporter n=1 Tax=Phycicoccus sp. CSK15P-2 TaxID=2807627 RepID=UPI001951C33E|nr:TSUP family transporter [Phycicoccus sp. CSK15P-2]MBM6404868.1 TSUP family transporter [Phycicoccus sp. CSK15P-2]
MGVDHLVWLPVGVLAGALTQRVTGVGFALVSAPILVLVAGPFEGVLLANLLGMVVCVVVLARTWREVEWRRGLLLAVPALVVIPAGAWVARNVPGPPLLVLVGSLVLVALAIVHLTRRVEVGHGPAGAVAAGATSGFMNVTAGVGGPAMVLYATSTRWDHRRFVATFQLYSVLVNGASLTAKGGIGGLDARVVLVALAALAVGLLAGDLLSRRVSAERAGRAVLALAVLGALSTVVKGLLAI